MKVRMWEARILLPLTALAFALLLLAAPAQAEVRSLFARSFGAFVPFEDGQNIPEKDRAREDRSVIRTVGGSAKYRKASFVYDTLTIDGLPAQPPKGSEFEFEYFALGANYGYTLERGDSPLRMGFDVSLEFGFGEMSFGNASLDTDLGFEIGTALRAEYALQRKEKTEIGLLAVAGFNYSKYSLSGGGADWDLLTASVPIMLGAYMMIDLGSELNVSGHAGLVVDPGYRKLETGNNNAVIEPNRPPVNLLIGGTIISKRKFVVNLGLTVFDDITLRLGFGFMF